jgi:hypothetical protein
VKIDPEICNNHVIHHVHQQVLATAFVVHTFHLVMPKKCAAQAACAQNAAKARQAKLLFTGTGESDLLIIVH